MCSKAKTGLRAPILYIALMPLYRSIAIYNVFRSYTAPLRLRFRLIFKSSLSLPSTVGRQYILRAAANSLLSCVYVCVCVSVYTRANIASLWL